MSSSVLRYEPIWGEIGTLIERGMARGVRSPVEMLEFLAGYAAEWKTGVEDELVKRMGIPTLRSGSPLLTLTVINGSYTLSPFLRDETLVSVVAEAVAAGAETVLELGSGWGRNLFRIAARLSNRQTLAYIGGEPTQAGRDAARRIAALDPSFSFAFHPFDYTLPDFSFVDRRRSGVVFTSHSIEQVAKISEGVILGAIDRFETCVGVHYEPVGWQRESATVERARQALAAGEPLEIANDRVLLNAARHALECGYNQNLLETLFGLERAGRIKIETIVWDMYGSNPFNPSTLIRWRAPA
jgi:hypothetical protein